MIYFTIDYSTSLKIVGSQYPQVWDFIKGYSPEVENNGFFTLYNTNFNGFPNQGLNLSGLKLANGAKYTDFISGGFADYLFIVSPIVKQLFDNLTIEEHRFYRSSIVSLRKKTIREYYIMKIISDNFKFIDFEKSTFVRKSRYSDKNKEVLSISSADDYFIKEKEINELSNCKDCIRSSMIKMRQEFYDLELDLFKISRCDNHWYISQKFFQKIKDAQLTGLEFTEVNL